MPVYVDDMRAPYKRGNRTYIMCHMVADSDDELHAMAQRIGVARRWHQKADTPHSHYDICLSMRKAAVRAGALEIDRKRLVEIIQHKRAAGREPSQPEGTPSAPSGSSCLVHGKSVAPDSSAVPQLPLPRGPARAPLD